MTERGLSWEIKHCGEEPSVYLFDLPKIHEEENTLKVESGKILQSWRFGW